jgi:hypothetical protein
MTFLLFVFGAAYVQKPGSYVKEPAWLMASAAI